MKQQDENFPITFPVTLTGHWCSPSVNDCSSIKESLNDWLLDEGSLTARLRKHCHHFHVKVIGERQELCTAEEASELIKMGEPVLVREVVLYCDNVPQVFARSLLPLASLGGEKHVLANLGDRPLGQVLFNNPSLQRLRLELSSFASDSSVFKLANTLTKKDQNKTSLIAYSSQSQPILWGRRSIFMLESKPLMVAEVFLPGAFAYL